MIEVNLYHSESTWMGPLMLFCWSSDIGALFVDQVISMHFFVDQMMSCPFFVGQVILLQFFVGQVILLKIILLIKWNSIQKMCVGQVKCFWNVLIKWYTCRNQVVDQVTHPKNMLIKWYAKLFDQVITPVVDQVKGIHRQYTYNFYGLNLAVLFDQ